MKSCVFIFLASLMIFLIACQKTPMGNEIGQVDCAQVTYALVIKPLFDRTCGGSDCHGPGGDDGEITNYNQTKKYVNNGDIKELVLDKREMPTEYVMTSEELAQVKCWLDDGALDN